MGNSAGFLLSLAVDNTQGLIDMDKFGGSVEQSFSRAAASTKPLGDALGDTDKKLISNRDTARLLIEELGIHMPRAVTSAIAEVMPAIGGMGTGLLAAFAIQEIPKFIEGIHDATDAMAGFGEVQKKAFEDVIAASDKAITQFKTIKEGINLEGEVNRNIAALSVQKDVLESTGGVAMNYMEAVYQFFSGNAAAAAHMAMAKAEKLDMGELAKLEA